MEARRTPVLSAAQNIREVISDSNWAIGAELLYVQPAAPDSGAVDQIAKLTCLSREALEVRRLVAARFGRDRQKWAGLLWQHFRAALEWDDAEECLNWARDMEATVAEMTAWRWAMNGGDPSSVPSPEPGKLF